MTTTANAGHTLITGVTGFLGQAVLERLLSSPGRHTRISVLIRSKGTLSAQDRLAQLLRKPVFRNWTDAVGGPDVARRIATERISVIDAGLDDIPELPGDLTAVVHSASTVSFDPPIDEAFATNVDGVHNLYSALLRARSRPHVVHVSTAYVGGLRKGVLSERPLDHRVDWRAESALAASARSEVEAASRRPEQLREAIEHARRRHSKAGPQAISQAAETYRINWVRNRLVDYGRTRARSLGWPDVYAFTKALAERVAEDLWAGPGHDLAVVRPSIVESALLHPYPGWIDGFKVADPLILAYGRGVLPEFPGLPDSVLDVVPVDFVVNSIMTLLATDIEPIGSNYFHLTTGARNPLLLREMHENVRDYFRNNPVTDSDGSRIPAPTWTFPGKRRMAWRLRAEERANDLAETALVHAPSSSRTRRWLEKTMGRRGDLETLRHYSNLYEPYTEAEIIYDDSQAYALHRRAGAAGLDGFDSTDIDWTTYLQSIHFPSVTRSMRSFSSKPAAVAATTPTLKSDPTALAIFDLEGTVVSSNTVEHYLWLRMVMDSRLRWAGDIADLALHVPGYLSAEDRDRGEFIRTFMRRYAGADVATVRKLMNGEVGDVLKSRMYPDAIRRIEAHRAAGHRTVLVTGSIDAIVAPLEPYFDDVIAGRMHERDGRWTGYLARPPLVDEARAAWLERYAAELGADLARSYAYGDSHADRSWLALVGNPRAVNPDQALFRHAVNARWEVEQWRRKRLSRLGSLADLSRIRIEPTGKGT